MSSEGVSACGLTRSAESRAKDIASVIPAMNLAPGRGGMNEVLLAVDMASPAMNDAPKRVMRWSALFLRMSSLRTASDKAARYFPETKLPPALPCLLSFSFPLQPCAGQQ